MELLGSLESKIIYEKPTRDEESNSKKEKKKRSRLDSSIENHSPKKVINLYPEISLDSSRVLLILRIVTN